MGEYTPYECTPILHNAACLVSVDLVWRTLGSDINTVITKHCTAQHFGLLSHQKMDKRKKKRKNRNWCNFWRDAKFVYLKRERQKQVRKKLLIISTDWKIGISCHKERQHPDPEHDSWSFTHGCNNSTTANHTNKVPVLQKLLTEQTTRSLHQTKITWFFHVQLTTRTLYDKFSQSKRKGHYSVQ
jgi:hypothetical protein